MVDCLPEAHLDFLEGADEQLGVVEWLDAFEPVQLGDLQQVLGEPAYPLDDLLGLVLQHLVQLEDHGVREGVQLDGRFELLWVLWLEVLLVLLDELDQLSAGEVQLSIELLLPVEVLQCDCWRFLRDVPERALDLGLREAVVELHLAQHGMPLEVFHHLLLGELVRVDELGVDALLRVLAVMLNRSHNQRVLAGLEQRQHLYLPVARVHLLPRAQQTVLAEVLQLEELLEGGVAFEGDLNHLLGLVRDLQQPIREVVNLQRLLVLLLVEVLQVILEAEIGPFPAFLEGHEAEQ